jgi:predicted nucleic acid-binding protein
MEGGGAMSDYCDSSFLIALYCEEEATSDAARKVAAEWKEPPRISAVTLLEVTNGFCRKVFEGTVSKTEAERCGQRFQRDLDESIFICVHLNLAVIFRDAGALSLKRTPSGGHRTLDLLHVAAAKVLGAKKFLSFDARLNALAKQEGLKVLR